MTPSLSRQRVPLPGATLFALAVAVLAPNAAPGQSGELPGAADTSAF